MIIGYSFWGFLGSGVTDTPDGGRAHRKILIDALIDDGHEIVFLQADRDHAEAGTDFSHLYRWDVGHPYVDALILEWRWPIPGRNTTLCGRPGHTCDLHRQDQLVADYAAVGVPTIVWDKDLRLAGDDPIRALPNVVVAEAALCPGDGARSLLFPVADAALDAADPEALAARPRSLPLVYVGNQYDRDEAFDRFLAPAAATYRHQIAGKWTDVARWPKVNFTGRVPFDHVATLHGDALATVLLLPDRYAARAQATQRLPEAVLAGCAPITPTTLRHAEMFTPEALHVGDGAQVITVLEHLATIAGRYEHGELIADCLARLGIFRASRQAAAIGAMLGGEPALHSPASGTGAR